MHGVNLDLLHATSRYHPDGQPKDPHAHHRAELIHALHEARRAARRAWVGRLVRLLTLRGRPVAEVACRV